jgi:hypothetical protein
MKYFEQLKFKDFITLISSVIISFTWVMISHSVLNQSSYRFIAFSVLIMLLLYLQYWINKPSKIWRYTNSISLILLLFVIMLSIIMHVIINNDLGRKILHLLLLCLITCAMPYLIAFIYMLTRKK